MTQPWNMIQGFSNHFGSSRLEGAVNSNQSHTIIEVSNWPRPLAFASPSLEAAKRFLIVHFHAEAKSLSVSLGWNTMRQPYDVKDIFHFKFTCKCKLSFIAAKHSFSCSSSTSWSFTLRKNLKQIVHLFGFNLKDSIELQIIARQAFKPNPPG